jgi:hypothetical protein
MLDPGDEITVDLPPHWLGAVFAGAVDAAGLERTDDAEVKVVGPAGLDQEGTILASALLPFATRFREPLPDGVLDHGILWAGQSDLFAPVAPAEFAVPEPDDRRIITDVNPWDHPDLLRALLHGSGSLVLVANPERSRWPAHSQSERATASVRATELI